VTSCAIHARDLAAVQPAGVDRVTEVRLVQLVALKGRELVDYTFEFGGATQDVTGTATGLASVAQLRQFFQELCVQPAFEPGMLILLDFCELDLSEIPQMDASEISRGLAELQDRCEGCAIAVISQDPLTSALLRAAEFRETVQEVDVWFAVTHEEALAWLELQRALAEAKSQAPR
jgi:hypothetical protein